MKRFLLGWALAALLAGCASVGQPGFPQNAEALSGRLSVRVDSFAGEPARSVSAAFDLRGTPSAGQLNLATPLGTVLAQARWSGANAWLTTSDGETAYPNLEALSADMLGERLPVVALFDWLRGRPWPGAPSRATIAPQAPGFEQLGWAVDLTRWGDGWITAQRDTPPKVTVRAQVERPD